jgi:beta-barrel assembly-enhancing protease
MNRRHFLAGAGCAGFGVTGSLHAALAAVDPKDPLPPLMEPGFRPSDSDEKGFWQLVDRMEEDTKKSNFLIRDAALNAYVKDLTCKLAGNFCPDVRVYVSRTPDFNAFMTPNGMMMVWSGLLLRMRNEAQLAAVLGHEVGHYLRRHTMRRFREMRSKSAWMPFLTIPAAVFGGQLAGAAVELALVGSIFANSRGDETEADRIGVRLMSRNKLDPREASKIWGNLLAEMDAAAIARGKKKAQRPTGMFQTHPAPSDRIVALDKDAGVLFTAEAGFDDGKERYRAAMKPFRVGFLEDQVKLADFGATDYLVKALASDGWDGELKYAAAENHRLRNQGEDTAQAVGLYTEALAFKDAPAEAHRGLGYALIRQGQRDAAKPHLQRYLEMKPTAPDRAMIQFNL